jgi:CheY-like chemotaxis protein
VRLLFVDDNAVNLELFRDILETAGHEVATEIDPVLGQARALAERFDVIVLDIQMPRIDGHAICRSLRVAGLGGPILALTSNALPEQVAAGTASGFDAYLTKPITPSALREAIARFGSAA